MTKSRPITEMKSIDWQHLENLEIPVVSEVVSACGRMNMHSIMNFNCDWNDEVITQFYAALHIDRENKVLHWSLQGKPFSIGYTQFAALLGFPSSDLERPMIHDKMCSRMVRCTICMIMHMVMLSLVQFLDSFSITR